MSAETKRENTPGIYIFVGENRSKTAQEKGWSWQECQTSGKPVLCAKPLWRALSQKGLELNPNEQVFFNLWDDEWKPNKYIPDILKELAEDGETVVAMGQKVHHELGTLGIPHKLIIHPAARGIIRRSSLYDAHVKKILG